ncbi:MAG: hypothetical protein D6748_06680, partial [Calditrichaeota bacterium]
MESYSTTIRKIFLLCFLISTAMYGGDVFWNNPSGGNWSDGTNWDTGLAPQPGDNVFITLDGTYTITLDVNMDVNSLALGAATGTQTLAATSRTLNATIGMTINANGVLQLDNSNTVNAGITSTGTIYIRGQGNTMNGALTLQTGSLMLLDASVSHSIITFNNTVNNSGTIRLEDNVVNSRICRISTGASGVVNNLAGGTVISTGTVGSR